MKKITLLLLFVSYWAYPQCNREATITICDITTVDVDSDGVPDGILNLYDAYFAQTGEMIEPGTWIDPNFDFVLNPATGDVLLWSLNEASENTNDYKYELYNSTCGDVTPALTINVVLGAFSGNALPPVGPNTINYRVCSTTDVCNNATSFNLLGSFQSNPPPHTNGYWEYNGASPNFKKIEGSRIFVEVPYQEGLPLVDEEIFELDYVVPDAISCHGEQRTTVRVSVVRQASSGDSQLTQICEQDIISGLYDADIKLSDDLYLVDEDLEGEWLGQEDAGTQIASPSDDIINIKELYEDLLATNPRFGVQIFNFRYELNHRSLVCSDLGSDVPFVVYESLRPFNQTENLILCVDGDTPDTINLLDQIQFTTENGVIYDYTPGDNAVWEFVSGPSTPVFTPEGEVTITGSDMGDYVFRYTVSPEINCDDNCSSVSYESNGCLQTFTNSEHLCATPESTLVNYTLLESLYPGENTANLELCDEEGSLDLISLLDTVGENSVYVGENGVWTDSENNIVSNDFVVPEIEDQQTFNFTYTTTNTEECVNTASLNFTIFSTYNAGTGGAIDICETDTTFNLFDILTGDKNTNGIWTGPNEYTASHLGEFDPREQISGDYTYRISGTETCPEVEAVVSVFISKAFYAGENTEDIELCNDGTTIDLISLLETDGVNTVYRGVNGVWTNEVGNVIPNDFIVTENEGKQAFTFTYTTTNSNGCNANASLNFRVLETFSSGIGSTIQVCRADTPFNLYDTLTGDKNTNGTWSGPNGYSAVYLGEFDPSIQVSGDYIYTIPTNETCAGAESIVTITVADVHYAGENTTDVELCNDGSTVDLIALLETNEGDEVYRGENGVWTNELGSVVSNDFTIPTITEEQTFNFTYTTSNDNGCEANATLSIRVVENFNSGVGSNIEICEADASFNLFDVLTGDKNINGTWSGPNGYNENYLGEFNPSLHVSGDYIYTISSNGTCAGIETIVSVTVVDLNYAGENTEGVVLCNDGTIIDLISLLETNGTNIVYRGTSGIWTDSLEGTLVENDFSVPVEVDGTQFFNFTYTTINSAGCEDSATLEFEVSSSTSAGIGEAVEVCETSNSFNLFDTLIGDKTTGGTWTGPNGYNATHLGEFNPLIHTSGDYIYTILGNGSCLEATATVSVTVNSIPNAGEDFSITVCKSEREINIFDYIASNIDNSGIITIQGTNTQVPLGVLDVSTIAENSLVLEYTLDANSSCATDIAIITINITATDAPAIIGNPSFCMMDGATLEDIDVDSETAYNWYDSEESNTPLSLQTILKRRTYYLSSVNEEGCESNRIAINVLVNDIGEGNCTSSIPDGVSPNGDGLNDVLDISELQESFPDFRISIYNRYGLMVYEGKLGTNYFSGVSNVSSSRGNELPAGVYYFVFEPNDGISKSFQDSFYLSR